MKSTETKLPGFYLVGISVRTNNGNEFNPATAKIGNCLQRFFSENIASKIPNRASPGILYCAYSDYESDSNGNYTYFVGEQVIPKDPDGHISKDSLPAGLELLEVPSQVYAQYTVGPGAMPQVNIEAWQKIWQTYPPETDDKRDYCIDFERYDSRAADPANCIFEIFIGIYQED